MKSEIYQIFYSEETRSKIDPKFIPLDNSKNERPDWREYWPIRNYLLSAELEDDTLYGFFSPKFFDKTKLDGGTVVEFLENIEPCFDFVNFSPYYDQAAFFQNVMEQAYATHKSGYNNIVESFSYLFPNLRISDLINTSFDTVYCNYFCATKLFWNSWITTCEKIFEQAENPGAPLFEILNQNVNYGDDTLPFKIFLVERVASILLVKNEFSIAKYDECEDKTYCNSLLFSPEKNHDDFMRLDAYKIAYLKTKNKKYMLLFSNLRQSLL